MDAFIGRSTELETIARLFGTEKGLALVTGETGVGKSRFLARVYEEYLTKSDFLAVQHPCRYSGDQFDPFVSSLAGLIYGAVATRSQQPRTETGALRMTGLALTQLGRNFGLACDFVVRVLEEINLKLGPLEIKAGELFSIADDVWRQMVEVQPSLELARRLVSEHAPSFVDRYAEIMEALRQDLPGRRLLMILDQVERVRDMTLDLLLDLAEAMPSGMYLILAVNEEALATGRQAQTSCQSFSRLEAGVRRLNGRVLTLTGLTTAEIGDWIQMTHGARPPDIELRLIRRATAGLPLLIEEISEHDPRDLGDVQSLSKSEYLDYCYERRLTNLEQDTVDLAYRLSVLQEPLPAEDYPPLLALGGKHIGLSECDYLRRQLEDSLVFSSDGWFRHETIKDYCERRMPPALCSQYHLCAAEFFRSRAIESTEVAQRMHGASLSSDSSRAPFISRTLNWVYHLQRAGRPEQFLITNDELLQEIIILWITDPTSMQSTLSSITRLEKLHDYCKHAGDRLVEAQALLWLGSMKSQQEREFTSETIPRVRLSNEAKQLYERALEIARSLPNSTSLTADCLEHLASTEWALQNPDRARDLFREGLKHRRKVLAHRSLDPLGRASTLDRVSFCLQALAELEYDAGNVGTAARYCKRFLRLIREVRSAERDWERSSKCPETHYHVYPILWGLYLLVQIYERFGENKKAVIICSLLAQCAPGLRSYKGAPTTTECMSHLRSKLGRRKVRRYLNDLAEIGFVPGEDQISSTYSILDIVNDRLL